MIGTGPRATAGRGGPRRAAGRVAVGAAVVAALVAGAAFLLGRGLAPDGGPAPAAESVCHACFWDHQDPAFRRELIRFYEAFATDDPLVAADVLHLLGRATGDPDRVCASFRAFADLAATEAEPARRLYAAETAAFTAQECGERPAPRFAAAAIAAREAGDPRKADAYDAVSRGAFRPRVEPAGPAPLPVAPPGTTAYVLGESAVRVAAGTRVGVQVERTVRDWLSYRMAWDLADRPADPATLLGYHEGARVADIARSAAIEIVPLPGALAVRRDGRWYAADDDGTFRFEVLPDKVQYPTTRSHGDLALLPDTHGISALVERAVRRDARLVVGCGDSEGKARASVALAARGIDVYTPCDRFVGDLLGYEGPGTILGSAPVRPDGDGAVVGDRPVTFATEEAVVVEDVAPGSGAPRYYDAPARYFRRLGGVLDLRLETVAVDGPGQAGRVVARAREVGASALAVRVWNEDDAAPVRAWLAESDAHRAVLFHSAPYPAGYRLFEEFPTTTTFGDPRPRFVTGPAPPS